MLFVGTIYASKQCKQTRNMLKFEAVFRDVMVLAEHEDDAHHFFWSECNRVHPVTQGYTNHRISVTQVPDEIVIYAAKELYEKLSNR